MTYKPYKYSIDFSGRDTIYGYRDAKFLDAQIEGNTINLWFLVDTDKPASTYEIIIVGTGYSLPYDIKPEDFIKTIHEDGRFVWHIFLKKH